MADQLGSRKEDSDYEIIWLFPSIEKTIVNIPLPFFVNYDLGSANSVSCPTVPIDLLVKK